MKNRLVIVIVCAVTALAAGVAVWWLARNPSASDAAPAARADVQNTPEPSGQAPEEENEAPTETPGEFHIAPSSLGEITITPLTSSAEEGVAADSAFLIHTSKQTARDVLSGLLTLISSSDKKPAAFTLTENNTDEFLLTPDEPLKHDEIYTMRYSPPNKHPLSFAFQTVKGFRVTSTTPGNEKYNVPADTGIEITFSDAPEDGLEDYFNISPPVTGRWRRSSNTYIFVPESLEAGANYTVTVKGGEDGVRDGEGNTLAEDYTFSFSTEWSSDRGDYYFEVFGDGYGAFLPGDEVFVELSMSNYMSDADINVDVYRLDNAEEFISGEPGNLIESFETKAAVLDNGYQQRFYITTGHAYEEGYYLFDIKTTFEDADYSCRKWIQVSPLSVYSLSVGGDIAVWVNDTETGLPAEGVSVRAHGGTGAVRTDAEGIALLPLNGLKGSAFVLVGGGANAFVYRTEAYEEKELEPNQKYFSYLYTDRSTYLPTDRINVFGALTARREEFLIRPGGRVTLKLGDIMEVPVRLDRYGCFEASLEIDGMYGGTELTLCVGGEVIFTKYISFEEYDREKYDFNATTDRLVYHIGEEVAVNASVSTLDGSPVDGMGINGAGGQVDVTTDKNGMASGSFTADVWTYDGYYNWTPNSDYNWFQLTNRDEYLQEVSTQTVVLPSTVMLEYEIIDEGTVGFTSSLIDRDALEEHMRQTGAEYLYGEEDAYRGEPYDLSFDLVITRHETVRYEIGEYYNFIEKRNVKMYRTESVDSPYETRSLQTVNGRVTVSGLPVSEEQYVYYSAEARFTDTAGYSIRTGVPIGAAVYDTRDTVESYSLAFPEGHDYSMAEDETVSVRISGNHLPEGEIITEGRMILIAATDKVVDAYTSSPAGADFTFLNEYIYNVSLFGAYFSGKEIYAVNYPTTILYDYSGDTLNFGFSFDKPEYKPGDTVTAELSVTDANGDPVRARLNVSVVDEAVLRANPNNPSFLSSWFNGAYNYIYPFDVYTSYTPPFDSNYGGGAEKGNGGGAYEVRMDFNDNPAFMPVETDSDGTGSVTFKLSDAVTSWRVTVHGKTADGMMGDAISNITATLPFYTDLVMIKTFLTGDEIAAYVKPHGERYRLNETPVKYEAELISGGTVIDTVTAEDAAGGVTVNFGTRPAGEYTVRVYAEMEDGGEVIRDSMQEAIHVTDSDIRLGLYENHEISASSPALATGYDITASPVSVMFTNGDILPLLKIIRDCTSTDSRRTDFMVGNAYARAFRQGALNLNAGDETPGALINPAEDYELSLALLNMYMGIAETDYGEPDLLYTARFAAAFPELMDRDSIVAYLQNNAVLYDTETGAVLPPGDDGFETDRAAGYLAMAALGERVLIEINEQAALIKEADTYEERLRVLLYATAYCAIGDDAAAGTLLEKFGIVNDDHWAVNARFTGAEKETLDAVLLFIRTVIDPPSAFEYLKGRGKANTYVSDVLEQLHFLKTAVPVAGVSSEVSYTLNGKTETVRLAGFDCVRLDVTAEQYERLNVKWVSGNTNAEVFFTGSPKNLNPELNSMKLNKTITPADNYEGLYRVRLELTHELASDGAAFGYNPLLYTVYDRIPSNMRFTRPSLDSSTDSFLTWVHEESPQITIPVYINDRNRDGSKYVFDYYVMKVSDAEAITPKAYVSHNFDLSGAWGTTE